MDQWPSRGEGWPTASITVLRQRAKLLAAIREFFDTAGYFEVDTPLLSADIVIDAWLDPFVATWIPDPTNWRRDDHLRFLQTSPEFAMKRLLAAGADSIYQLSKVFRNGEIGQRHNPEFTMLEWYRCDDDLPSLMKTTEALVKHVFTCSKDLMGVDHERQIPRQMARVLSVTPFQRLTYEDAFVRFADCSALDGSMAELRQIASKRGLVPPPGLLNEDRDGWLNFLLAELIEPNLGRDCPVFLTNYPGSQAALARLSADGRTAERFELYLDGIELCNGYHELTDPVVLRERMTEQSRLRSQAGFRPLPETNRLLVAMEAGLPSSAGNALGVDRLIMLALGKERLSDVIAFPFEIA
ncbi:EF-P lysine aminoacylase EpmA [Schlesneria paludicola]|uniref:EF-P lysine aminoacylase EpmA n=1 Tax=Schlesneria paludicola TaxID=360056 RepID=UPI0002D94F19|nr:EF-P lysine aminoacylase EpmA [Schlesneria paludicola]